MTFKRFEKCYNLGGVHGLLGMEEFYDLLLC